MAPTGQSQPPFLSIAMYGGDGSFTTCGGYKALPSIPVVQEVGTEASPGYGRWAATGDRELRLTFYGIIWKEGLGNGYQRVQETLVLWEGDEYTGHAQVDFLDANWTVVFSIACDVKGTRLETRSWHQSKKSSWWGSGKSSTAGWAVANARVEPCDVWR